MTSFSHMRISLAVKAKASCIESKVGQQISPRYLPYLLAWIIRLKLQIPANMIFKL